MTSSGILQRQIRVAAADFDDCAASLRSRCDARRVHAVRVAERRLRVLLWSMKPWLKHEPRRMCRSQLQAVAGPPGRLRDFDVIRDMVLRHLADMAGLSAPQRTRLDVELRRQRAVVRRQVLTAIHSIPYMQQCRQIHNLLTVDTLFRKSAPADAARWRSRVLRGLEELSQESRRARRKDLHRIRLLVKRCRYSLEALGPWTPHRMHRRMRDLQSLLGCYCDARLAARWLECPQSLRDQALRERLGRAARLLAGQRARIALRALRGLAS